MLRNRNFNETMSALGDQLDHDERLVLNLFLEEFKDEIRDRRDRFLMGCYVSAIFLEPKECRSRPRLGYYCDVTRERIRQVEERGLRKLRMSGKFDRDELDWLCRMTARACKDYGIR